MTSGGLFRTDGGVKGTSGLDVGVCADAWSKVRSDEAGETWLVLGYEGKDKLKVQASGSGGSAELLEQIDDAEISFGGFRAKDGKFYCLMCTGENVGGMAKGRAAAHKNAAFNALDGTVGEVCGQSKEEFIEKLKEIDF
mmetsp:Transcript_38759/g.60322  ORF Transcript_38759/g.60322 Transcript_38759/m.60322 type:complete len:139 (-) Transcript_38759:63-479(-)